ncbi:MAG TPA: hypothetical protein VGG44_08260 [Tepidisphaeraceae bacterium]|jgi:ElaB/YqjD/DUF883 family membrane-anchored ribosome-binding protein
MAHTNQGHGHSHGSNGPGSETDELKHKVADVAEDVRAMGGQVGKAAREQYENLRSKASDYVEQGRGKAEEWESDLEGYIKAKPVQALLVAAGVGVILGLLWRRR